MSPPLPMPSKPPAPASPEDLLSVLDHLGIEHDTLHHDPAHTVEDAKRVRGPLNGIHTKNLFVRDKKRNMFLVTLQEHVKVDLPRLSKLLGAKGRFSFGSEELLMKALGVTPGSVTPFSVINDHGHHVTLVLDTAFRGPATLFFHPLKNDKTTGVSFEGFSRFLTHCAVTPVFVDFETLTVVD